MKKVFEIKDDFDRNCGLVYEFDDCVPSLSALEKIVSTESKLPEELEKILPIRVIQSPYDNTHDGSGDSPLGDINYLAPGLVCLNLVAYSALADKVKKFGRFLPLLMSGIELIAFYPTVVLQKEALDLSGSDISFYPDGRIRTYRNNHGCLYFQNEWLKNAPPIFRLTKRGPILVTDLFVDVIQSLGLTGAKCEQLWPHTDIESDRLKYLVKRKRKKGN